MTPDFGTLGFGFLRLPHIDPDDSRDVDLRTAAQMVDLFLQRGFRYFDTAYTYLDGMSEISLRKTLVERHPRETFMIADKLPCGMLRRGKTREEIFAEQLRRCGVDYFDVYLLHGLDGEDAAYAEEQGCFDFLRELKQQGKARYIGFSFHDTADVLDGILTRHPEAAARLFSGEAPAHRALRFAASREGVAVVLSGMSTPEQMDENTRILGDLAPLTDTEEEQLRQAAEIIRNSVAIPCTGCAYCTPVCPAQLPIPRYFSLYNERKRDGWQVNAEGRYLSLTKSHPAADQCLGCRRCEQECPQKLGIAEFMKQVSQVFDR